MGIEPLEATEIRAPLPSRPDGELASVHELEITAPIVVRGQVLGTLMLRRDANQAPWSVEEIALVEQTIGQIGPALESARLLEEAQRRAAREQAVNVIATQVRGAVSLDAVLQNTVRELGKALGASRTFIRFGLKSPQMQAPEKVGINEADDRSQAAVATAPADTNQPDELDTSQRGA
jgi:hypothetical protein